MTAPDAAPTLVREERRLGPVGRVGVVRVAPGQAEQPDDHRAAAAQAWLLVARGHAEADAAAEAYAAARSGVEELGQAYVDPGADDDSTLALLAAEDAREEGLVHAAGAMARVLEDRLGMYAAAQRGRVTLGAPPGDGRRGQRG